MAYRGLAKKLIEKRKVTEGDLLLLHTRKGDYEGILMPRTELGDEGYLVLKLSNGYNVGIEISGSEKIEKLESRKIADFKKKEIKPDPSKPTTSIIHTGGTIASRVDYRTGGVVSAFTPEELFELFPSLADLTNINAHLVSNMFSEDVEPEHWRMMARQAYKEMKKGTDGVIITHGTDTLHTSSAAVSFMLPKPAVPVLFVGSQRSSDRGSSDAEMNLMCAANFAVKSDFAGVAICMHARMGDAYCYVHEGTKTRKMHASRRDTFRSINQRPWAKCWPDGRYEYIRPDYSKKDKGRKPVLKDKMEEKVGLVKVYPGFDPSLISFFTKNNYKGLVIEGTGLGHAPTNVLDEFSKMHGETLQNIRDFVDSGGTAVMTTQCLFGRINMNVYSTGRDLLAAGVIPGEDMLPEVANIKLKWVLGQTKKKGEIRKMMLTNIAGEITPRTDPFTYDIGQ